MITPAVPRRFWRASDCSRWIARDVERRQTGQIERRLDQKLARLGLNNVPTSQIRDKLSEKKPIRSAEMFRELIHSGIIPQLGTSHRGVSSVGRASDF